ncbi:MAG: hypothetical protein K1X74_04370 [Pirellulales bacterium]|nr:hypothetical protein [Pirellulales bacterium]
MWPREFSARRLWCRATFVAVAALPTIVFTGWAIWRNSPAHRSAVAAAWEQALGLPVSIGRIEHLRPGVCACRQVVLHDPETGAPWLALEHCELAQATTRNVITASGVRVDARAAGELWTRVELALRRRSTGTTPLRVVLQDIIAATDGPAPLARYEELVAMLEGSTQGPHLAVDIRIAGVDEPLQIALTRDRRQSPPVTSIDLRSPAALPCRLAAAFCPALDRLGPEATFRGNATLTLAADGLRADVYGGEFQRVDLGRLLADAVPARWSGRARLTLKELVVARGRLQLATGRIDGDAGQISYETFMAAVNELALPLPAGRPLVASIPYERLATAFHLHPDGLTIVGDCPELPPGTILVGEGRAILASPASQQPVSAWSRTLAAIQDASRQAQRTATRVAPRQAVPPRR